MYHGIISGMNGTGHHEGNETEGRVATMVVYENKHVEGQWYGPSRENIVHVHYLYHIKLRYCL